MVSAAIECKLIINNNESIAKRNEYKIEIAHS